MALPTGLVTFLLTDVVDSTHVWRERDDAGEVMRRQAEIIAGAVERHNGVRPVEQGEGDSVVAVFTLPTAAIEAAIEAQRALVTDGLPGVRMGINTGEAELVDDSSYGGTTVIRAARIRDLGNQTEILLSASTAALAGLAAGADWELQSLGEVELKGFDRTEPVHRVIDPALPNTPSAVLARSRLPTFPTSFVGRADDVAEVVGLIDANRLVTITGSGGSGKTRLAHAVAERLVDRRRDVVWVDLSTAASRGQVLELASDAVGVRDSLGEDLARLVTVRLDQREAVLVLDNCEHLLEDVAALACAVVDGDGRARVLTTTREPIGLTGEATWRIPSLRLPAEGAPLEQVLAAPAVELFVERGRAQTGHFELDDETAPVVARICRRLDGIPLALELAAARLRSLPLLELADRLDDRFAVLTTGSRGAMERQRTLLASVRWSHDLLDDTEKVVFRRLSAFAAPFTLAAAEHVVAGDDVDTLDVLDVLGRLVDKSLVRLHDGRYTMLETLRAFAADRVDDAGEAAGLRDRHYDWCHRRALSWGYPDRASAADQDDQVVEVRDFEIAVRWGLAHDAPDLPVLLRVLYSVQMITSGSGMSDLLTEIEHHHPPGSRLWLEAVPIIAVPLTLETRVSWLAEVRDALASEDLDDALRARLEFAAAVPGAFAGDRDAIEAVASAGERLGALGQDLGRCQALITASTTAAMTGHIGLARRFVNRTKQVEHGSLRRWLAHHLAVASIAIADCDFAGAVPHIRLATATGAPYAYTAWLNLGFYTGDRPALQRVLEMAEGSTGVVPTALRLWAQAATAWIEGDLDDAAAILDEMDEYGFGGHGAAGGLRAEISLHQGNLDNARRWVDSGGELDANAGRSELLCAAAVLAMREGDATQAIEHAMSALAFADRNDDHLHRLLSVWAVAVAAGADGDDALAARALAAADADAERLGFSNFRLALAAEADGLRERLVTGGFYPDERPSVPEVVAELLAASDDGTRPVSGWASLTPAEERVVALVGDGRSNPEIAEALHISVSTVKTHLVHAYQKLGLPSRSALAAEVARRDLVP